MNLKEFTKGIFKENPVFVLLLGLCPTLGVSTKVFNGIGMGLGVIFVVVCSNVAISLLKNVIPDKIRIPAYIVIIATFVSVVEMVLQAFIPALYESLGIFIPLIVVNCIVLGRAEAFAGKNSVGNSFLDGLGIGIGFLFSIFLISFIREVLGMGTITLWESGDLIYKIIIPGLSDSPISIISSPAGALLIMGIMIAGINQIKFYSKNIMKKKYEVQK